MLRASTIIPEGSLRSPRVAVIGAGIAGLVAAVDLAHAGFHVMLFEQAAGPGGKMREVEVDGLRMDAGPTVFTLRRVFDEIFADAGERLEDHVTLKRADVLARHAWDAESRLDLHADAAQSADAIARFAGAGEAAGFLRFAAQAKAIYATLEKSFMMNSRPTPWGLVRRAGFRGMPGLWGIQPFTRLWDALGAQFRDPRLRQLFGRYATYCGSSPFQSPATLMLVAHVEQAGVWMIEGGMHRLAAALAGLAGRRGAEVRYGAPVSRILIEGGRVHAVELASGERITVDAVVSNADNNALATGCFGPDAMAAVRATPPAARSLSAVTWNLVAAARGFPLAHHTVFFGGDYAAEFDDIFRRRRLPAAPTVYVCAQDRSDDVSPPPPGAERLLCLVNAPPIGDVHRFDAAEIQQCESRTFELLARCGLHVTPRPGATQVTNPADFHRLFPATGGALYGPASHGWMASFTRPGSRSRIRGLYLAGGSTHPGPGVPMVATSGRLAAASILADYASIAPYRPVAMSGGTSTR
jgi:1-hydroxycarotenoid 3,4-desaturase